MLVMQLQLHFNKNKLYDDCSNINVYVGEDGNIHFTDKDGADSVLPFSKPSENYSITARVRTQGGNYYTLFLEILVNGTLVSSKVVTTSNDGKFSKPSSTTTYNITN